LSILTIDQRRRCAIIDAHEVQLTPQEYRLLAALAEQPGAVVGKAVLLAAMWGSEMVATERLANNPMAVDLVVFRLRKKLGDRAQCPRFLETRRGFGYILHNAQLVFVPAPNNPAPRVPEPPANLIQRPVLPALSVELLDTVDNWSALTQREWELFMQLGQEDTVQLTNRALARRLGIAENTLKKHLQNLYRKLDVSNRAAAAILSARVQLHLYLEQQLIKGTKPMDTIQQEQNAAIVRRYYQALALRDTAVIAPFLADEVVRIGIIFPDEPPVITRGKAQLLARIQRVIDDNGEIDISNLQVEGDKVTCHARIATDTGRREGIAPLAENVEFLLQEGKILSYKVVSTPESAAKIRAVAT
jgi:DNA-binding CsgD family transcriptional regulator/DNA-binding winged helix-turn-helix (wHTH) protein/ketosteroid isomerase-like protein